MFANSSKFVVAAVAFASVVSASSPLDSVSSTCQSAVQAVIVAPEAQCLNLGPLLTAALTGGTIDVPALANTWLTGLCAAGSCSQASLSAIVKNVTIGCASDVKSLLGIDISDPNAVLPWVTQYYPPVRQIACLKDTSANTLCVTQTLTNLQSIIGPIGSSSLDSNTINADAQKLVSSDYKKIACTNCIKQAYTIISKVFPDPSLLAQANGPITQTCGASFIDGQNVSTVAQTAVAGDFVLKSTTKSGAVPSFAPLKAGVVLAAISSAFVALA